MKRPGHSLTWYSIRRRYSMTVDHKVERHYPSSILRPTDLPPTSHVMNHSNKRALLFSIDLSQQRLDPKLIRPASSPSVPPSNSSQTTLLSSELQKILSELNVITNHIQQQQKYDDASQDWKFVAMVIDRLCLILFTVGMTVFTLLTLVAPLRIFDY